MSISLVLLAVMVVLYACGVYLLLERSMTKVLLGFLLVGNATNLLILIMAGAPGAAPIASDGVTSAEMTDPLPQALILTAIVITFAVSAFLLALIYRSWRLGQKDELDDDEADRTLRTARLTPSDFARASEPDYSEFDADVPDDDVSDDDVSRDGSKARP